MLTPIALGSVRIDPPVFLAPMAGVTDQAFRAQVRRFGVGHVVSEMVTAAALLGGHVSAYARLQLSPDEASASIQIAGRTPEEIGAAARAAAEAGAAIVDINMGCPAKKVTGGYAGSALMRDPDLAARLVAAAVEALGADGPPVTLKTRLGWDRDSLNAPDIARRAVDAGAQLLTIHGRTRQEFYRGAADWAAVRATVDAVDVPVIVNGDINGPAAARAALAASGAAGVMIGRAANGRPWLPAEIMADFAGRAFCPPSAAEALALAADHHRAMRALHGDEIGLRAARKHLGWRVEAIADVLTACGVDAAALRARLMRLETGAEVESALTSAADAASAGERLAA